MEPLKASSTASAIQQVSSSTGAVSKQVFAGCESSILKTLSFHVPANAGKGELLIIGDSFDNAVGGIRRLEKAGADYNLLTVVSRANVAKPRDVYLYLRDSFSTRYHQYIECTGPRDAISGEEWGAFLVGLFDEWIKRDFRETPEEMAETLRKIVPGMEKHVLS